MTNSNLNTSENRIARINELERIVAPIQMNLENLQDNIHRFKELSNAKLLQYIKENNNLPLDPNTTLEFTMDDRYSRIRITNNKSNGSWRHGFEVSIELHGFSTFSMLESTKQKFDPKKIQFSISGASCNPNLENIQSLDTEIIKAFFCIELKKFGMVINSGNFFSMYSDILQKYFSLLQESYDIKSEIYPYTNEISKIKKEIEQEEKAIQDAETLVQITNSIGQKLEHNTELYEQNKDEYRYKYARSLKSMFNIDWNVSYIKILKVSAKTITIQLGDSIYETKRVKKEDMIRNFPMIKVMEVKENA